MDDYVTSRNLNDQISEFDDVLERRNSFQDWVNEVTASMASPPSPPSRHTPSPNVVTFAQVSQEKICKGCCDK
jgi:hypothetical protein